ncbi:MAG: hypothetical protein GY715_22025 [Planctomycetes bacterium]|nr:hypothetical protein [Planctomycetota bacterium]
MLRHAVVCACVAPIALGATDLAAQTVTIEPVQDATLIQEDAHKANGAGQYIFAGRIASGERRRAPIMFDVAGALPPFATITGVTLRMNMSRTIVGSEPVRLHRLTADWTEGSSDPGGEEGAGDSATENDPTWLYRSYRESDPETSPAWSSGGATGDYIALESDSTMVGGNGYYFWSSSAMITDAQGWLDDPGSNHGWIIVGDESSSPTAKRFDSRQHPTASRRPQLIIDYDQPPSPPDVELIAPNGGEVIEANGPTTAMWTASDESGIQSIDLYLSDDGGLTWEPILVGLPNTGSATWFPPNRPAVLSLFRVVATDLTFDTAQDDSNAFFTVSSPPGGIVPTTLRDFDEPGSQPFEAGTLHNPDACVACHANYGQQSVEPYFNWQGSMMAQASIDPLFEACMAIANQDAPDSGDLCLRCHLSRGWLRGRSRPTDGSEMLDTDLTGVSCDLCHRLVDPFHAPENPAEDFGILSGLSNPPMEVGTAMYVVDPTGARRGPFADASSGHPVLVSPYHREAALCGTCHDVSNPAFESDGAGGYVPNALDTPAADFSPHVIGPVERTYSEWFNSAYNSPGGVFAPQFGGNSPFVNSCQDCHMRDVTGRACNHPEAPTRPDLPLHDMTGGSTWLPTLLASLYPDLVDAQAVADGVTRAQYMLQNAALLDVYREGDQLFVRVTNDTGHKLPTGYPEGRRMWLNVKFFDDGMSLLSESGAYDASTGVLTHDPEVKIYEILPVTEGIPGVPDGTEFHFVLNNAVAKDNRIPPRGFIYDAYEAFGGAPVGATYADGEYWDITQYAIPPGTVTAEVTLYYQSTSKEFIEFLRDENTTNSAGDFMYNLWNNNGKCPPELMRTELFDIPPCPADLDASGDVGFGDILQIIGAWGPCGVPCPEDISGNGAVDFADILAVIAAWGPCL